MSLADLSIKRPIFITCVVFATLCIGFLSYKKIGVDMLPNVTFPIVTVTTVYRGAGPKEIETLVSKVLEDEISNVPGIKSLKSISREGVSTVVADFTLETDVKYAEQQVRDRVSSAKRKLPEEIDEPTIRRLSPSDQPIMYISLGADLPPGDLYDFANEIVKPQLEQVNQVGLVEVVGGRKRELQVELDRRKLNEYEMSASFVANRLSATGENVPVGKVDEGEKEQVFRTLGEFTSVKEIGNTVVNFLGNDIPVRLSDVAKVKDSLMDEQARSFVNGEPSLFILLFRQSGANTVKVADAVKAKLEKLNAAHANDKGAPKLTILQDMSKFIRVNVTDVNESILLGIILTIIVVYLFLGNWRSTIITGLALPNSLLGAFILMSAAGFTINSMTLLALSLSVGLLIDDAIVVRENIFRHMEEGKTSIEAAIFGTREVSLAVIATTLAVLAVFGPVGFLKGVVGQFFKEFALTICFAMMISLFDALTIAPMLSAYFAGNIHAKKDGIFRRIFGFPSRAFGWLQDRLDDVYEVVLKISLNRPIIVMFFVAGVVFVSCASVIKVPKTFLSPQDFGDFSVSLELPPGTNLDRMTAVATEVDKMIRENPEIRQSYLTVGNREGQKNVATLNYSLVDAKQRKVNTSQFKDVIREQVKPFAFANPKVTDMDFIGGGMRPFNVNIIGEDLEEVAAYTQKLFKRLENHPALTDVDTNYRPGKPEVQVAIDQPKAVQLGVSSTQLGLELRSQVEGVVPAVYRENGREYDIRVRMQPDQRNLKTQFPFVQVPNINNQLLRLKDIAELKSTEGPATISRQDRGRYVQIGADIRPGGPGMGAVMKDIDTWLASDPELKLPEGMRYQYVGQAESFQELLESLVIAVSLAVLFTFLVLSSLYESFITPFSIMLVLPLAVSGASVALYIAGSSLDINSMIGCILLLGLASKNSILLVDYANQQVKQFGKTTKEAMLEAGRHRLRPILMTTLALISGMLPIAIGLNEASKQRTSMGIAVIGGLISSTILSLIIVPAVYPFIERFRVWGTRVTSKLFGVSARRPG
ncbi:MAG: efflux RND transporter permease subunit [Oligoflexales bacterium]